MANRHIMEHAKARVVIEDGKVVDVGEPLVRWCPLHERLYGERTVHSEGFIRKHVEEKISSTGMFTEKRIVESDEDLVPLGASEMLMCAKKRGLIDCAVLACDCAGTVIAITPELIQGIGGWMAGLVSTSPIAQVIRRLEKAKAVVINPEDARIDQVEGVRKAFELGFRRVAVTIAGAEADRLSDLRKAEKGHDGLLAILVIHTTGVDREMAEFMAEFADLVWACASNSVWEIVGPRASLQIGVAIPVFVMTELGEEIVLARATDVNRRASIHSGNLPHIVEKRRPRPLV